MVHYIFYSCDCRNLRKIFLDKMKNTVITLELDTIKKNYTYIRK